MTPHAQHPTHPPSGNTSLRALWVFVLRFAVFYAASILLWMAISGLYANLFCFGCRIALQPLTHWGQIAVQRMDPPRDARDVEIRLQPRHSTRTAHVHFESHAMGYSPTAFLLALVLATPLGHRQRWAFLGWGLALLGVFLAIRVIVPVLRVGADPSFGMFATSRSWSAALERFEFFFNVRSETGFVVVILIWIGLMMRSGRLPTWLDSGSHDHRN